MMRKTWDGSKTIAILCDYTILIPVKISFFWIIAGHKLSLLRSLSRNDTPAKRFPPSGPILCFASKGNRFLPIRTHRGDFFIAINRPVLIWKTFLALFDNRILRLSVCGTSGATVCETRSRSVKGILCNTQGSFSQTSKISYSHVGTRRTRAQVFSRNSGKAWKRLIVLTSEGSWLLHLNSCLQDRNGEAVDRARLHALVQM